MEGAQRTVFTEQAAVLRLVFLNSRIAAHRRFLPPLTSKEATSPQAVDALAVCTESARATTQVLRFTGHLEFKTLPTAGFAFGAGLMLVISMWDLKRRSPSSPLLAAYEVDIQQCQKILAEAETRCAAKI